ncbi:hypothetical protein ccbrp13_40950 [Ktedonobacteria bacterium brp13]|nr:hypothetical protein ccbrp13_40950 [Ktedonobacteria bacterium brp13]
MSSFALQGPSLYPLFAPYALSFVTNGRQNHLLDGSQAVFSYAPEGGTGPGVGSYVPHGNIPYDH